MHGEGSIDQVHCALVLSNDNLRLLSRPWAAFFIQGDVMRILAIGITSAIVILCGTMLAIASGPGLTVVGNTLRDSNNNIVVLHGVDRAGTDYACIQGWGIFDSTINVMNDDAEVPLIKSWGANSVTIGLNEDCWLAINGSPAAYSGTNYINAIKHEVATLE